MLPSEFQVFWDFQEAGSGLLSRRNKIHRTVLGAVASETVCDLMGSEGDIDKAHAWN